MMMISVAVDYMRVAHHAGTAGAILGFAGPVHSNLASSSRAPPPPPPSAQHLHQAPKSEEPSPAASTTGEDQQGHSERLETLFYALRELLRPSGWRAAPLVWTLNHCQFCVREDPQGTHD